MSKKIFAAAALFVCATMGGAAADDASDLGGKLTPVGAERAGNAAGTIPAWDGGLATPPAGYTPGGDYVDPYASDAKLFSIDKSNLDRYKDNLTAGQRAIFARFPDYRMDVYPTHRSCALPKSNYEKTKQNVGVAKLDPATGDLVAAVPGGLPFPLPQNGAEAMWNHRLAFEGIGRNVSGTSAVVNAAGSFVPQKWEEVRLSNYYNPANATFDALQNVQLKYFTIYTEPARLAGEEYLVHETLNGERNAWIYSPGLRRVRRAPTLAYDNPSSGYEGLATNDQLYMFNGRLDRYDWKLVGKKELYVPYNNFAFASPSHRVKELVKDNFTNRDLMRYELHRVWVVDATLKQGIRHMLPHRVFYIDEDSWRILATDIYDGHGNVWRYQEETTVPVYDVPTCFSFGETFYDFQTGRYILDLAYNDDKRPDFHAETNGGATDDMFTIGYLRKRGTR